ncbi:MAG: CotH kinase family protein [Bacteroidales bacterium]|nr:CotH kinase family protein [Bacteroidales bacterium]
MTIKRHYQLPRNLQQLSYPKNGTATLSCTAAKGDAEISYQWYLHTDESDTKIEGATENTYTTEFFAEKETKYYYCKASCGNESITSDVVAVAYTGLATLYINTIIPTNDITKEEYVFGDIKLIYESGEEVSYTFKTEKNGEKKEGIKGRGNSSWTDPKKGYNIKFDKKQSFFNLPSSKKWCIVSNYEDKTLLRNKFASLLGNEIFNSEWNPTFINIDVVMNGEYMGNYTFMEKNNIGDGRIDIQDISDCTTKKISSGDYTDQNGDGKIDLCDGGFVIEICGRLDTEFWFKTSKRIPITLQDPDEVSEKIQEHIKLVIQQAEDALYSDNFCDIDEGWRKYFDECSVIDWYFLNEIANNRDAKSSSSIYKYYSPTDQKIHFGPLWDFDRGFGNDGQNGTIDLGKSDVWYIKDGWWIIRMFEDPLFVNNLKKRWNEKKSELYTAINRRLQQLADINASSAEVNFKRWRILGEYVWPNPAGAENRTTYQSEIDYMKNWLNDRYAWFDAALNNSYTISYDLYGGAFITSNPEVFISESTDPFTLNNPERDGYVFAGWIGTGLDVLTESVTVTDDHLGDKKFTAVWRRNIAFCDISMENTNQNEEFFTPNFIVKDGDRTLVNNIDYTISAPKDYNASEEYTVTFFGQGSYGGSVEKTFSISQFTPVPEITPHNNIKIWSYEKRVFVENAESEIIIVDMSGRIVNRIKPNNDHMEIQLSNDGIYIVKTGLNSQKILIK